MKDLKLWASLALLLAGSGCGGSSTQPSANVSVTWPPLMAPADNQQFKFAEQPLTLTVKNAVTTDSTPPTYTFQVATDAAFATIVSSKAGVPAGANGQTSVTIDKLPGPAAANYFWRAQAVSGSVPGLFTKPRAFGVGPQIILQAPVQTFPSQNETVSGSAILTVTNVSRSGPVGQISYQFDVSDSSSFSNIVFTANVLEQSTGQTSVEVPVSVLASDANYFWRVQATDGPSGVTSPSSTVFSFHFIAFSMSQATIIDSPYDLASWAETAKITSINFTSNAILVDFDRRDGPNRWPDSGPPGDSLEYTLGMCLNLHSHWYCSAPIQFWYGRELTASGLPSNIATDWFYNPAAWHEMCCYQPAYGELVGIFVGAGNLRHKTDGSGSTIHDRSNVVLMPFGGNYSLANAAASVRASRAGRRK